MNTYDFETMNNAKVNPVGIMRNGWTIVMYKMMDNGAYYNEYPPVPDFYAIHKYFYPNGNIKLRGKYMAQHLSFGEWIYYDEQGNIIKKVDEDAKFGKYKIEDILKFIEKEGWIDLKTGEGREHAIIHENGECDIIPSRFSVYYADVEKPYWIITIDPARYNEFHRTIYHLDIDTGEVLFKESERVVMEE